MKRSSILGILSVLVLGAGGAGCAADATGEGADAVDTSAKQGAPALVQGTVLATLSMGGGRTVTFRELDGSVLVGEEGPAGQPRDLDTVRGSLLDVYRTLSNGAEPPSALVAAAGDLVAAGATSLRAMAAPPVTASRAKAAPPRVVPEGTVEQNFCENANTTQCITGTNVQIGTSWSDDNELGYNDYAQNINVLAVNGGTKSATYAIQKWNGSAWTVFYSNTTQPGWWYEEYAWTSGKSYWQVYETATGGSAEAGIQSFIPQVYEPAFYPSSAELVFDPYNFVHDTTVNLLMQWPNGDTLVSRSGLSISNLANGGAVGFACGVSESPFTATITVTGVQTGEVATGTVAGVDCTLE